MTESDRPATVEWRTSRTLVAYPDAVAFMECRVDDIGAGRAPETVWLVEHPPIYTAGTSARIEDLLDPHRLPVFRTGRGGQFTYHGPGQRVGYVMLDLRRRGSDVRAFVAGLEAWIIATLAVFGVRGERRSGRVGIWVADGTATEAKIAAIGVRIRRWVSYHGIAINVDPDLGHFDGIVPCGTKGYGVTSLRRLGLATTMDEVDRALAATFTVVFGGSVPRKT